MTIVRHPHRVPVARGTALKQCVEHTVRDREVAERHIGSYDAGLVHCQDPTLRRSEGAEAGHPGSAALWQGCSLRAWPRSVGVEAQYTSIYVHTPRSIWLKCRSRQVDLPH